MDNPKFGVTQDGSGDGSDSDADVGATETGEGGSETGTSTSTDGPDTGNEAPEEETASSSSDDGTSDTGQGMCDYGRTPPLDITWGPPDQNTPCPDYITGTWKFFETINNGWTVEPCGDGCNNCDPDKAQPFTMWPLQPQDVVSGTCFWVQAESSMGQDPNNCRYRGVTLWREGEATETPTLIGSTNSFGTPPAAMQPLAFWEPMTEKAHDCPCEEVDVQNCCENELPAAHAFGINGNQVFPGDWVHVQLGEDPKQFEFHSVQAYFPGRCGDSVQDAWALLR
jgi:hypothetical protein